MRKIIFLFLFFVTSYAYSSGTTSGTIFNLNPLPVDAGLNVLCYAGATPLESLVYNPAYAVTENYYFGLSAEIMPLDMYSGSIIYMGNAPFGKNMGLGGMLKYFTSGEILKMDTSGDEVGNFSVDDFMFSGLIGMKMEPGLFTGLRLNILNERIIQSQTGVSFDLGLGYDIKISKTQKLFWGITTMNIGSKMWNEPQPVGIGTGILFRNNIFSSAFLEYGIGLRWRLRLDYDIGPSLRYSNKINIGINKFLKYKIGISYYYNKRTEQNGFLQGIKFGIFVDTTFHINFGYELVSYPWGMGNKLFLGYKL